MRNTWYPRQRAEYVTAATLQGMKLRDVVAERDFTFGMKSEEEEAPKLVQEAKSIETRIKLLLVSSMLGLEDR